MKLDNRIWILLTALVSVGVLAGAWFLGAAPLLASSDATRDQQMTVEAQNRSTQAQIAQLKKSESRSTELAGELADLSASIPNDIKGAAFIGRVQVIAAQAGVTVKGIILEDPVPYTPGGAEASAAAAAASTGASASPSASASATASPTPTPTGPAAPAPSTDPLVTATNFVLVPVTVEVQGSRAQTLAFTKGIQHDSRLFLVTAVSSKKADGPTGSADNYDVKLGGDIYVLLPSTTPATGSTTTGG